MNEIIVVVSVVSLAIGSIIIIIPLFFDSILENRYDIFLKSALLLVVVIPCLLLGGNLGYNYLQDRVMCKTWEEKIVYQEAFTTYMKSMPIYHPAGYYTKNVCVESR